MINDEYTRINSDLDTNYHFIKAIKNTESTVIKVLENNMNGRRVLVKYLIDSAKVYEKIKNISHPNIPIVYNVEYQGEDCIIVEEYIDGISLGDMLEVQKIPRKQVKRIVKDICDALDELHKQGIIHRDIKPENIIIDNYGKAKLIDFNISRFNKETETKDTKILGTTGFAAPEQYGICNTDARSDIYSIGILINVLLTGEHPSKKLCKGKWKHIVNKCTKINPDERYQKVKELVRDINDLKNIFLVVFSVIVIFVAVFSIIYFQLDKPNNRENPMNQDSSPEYMYTPTVDYDDINMRYRVFWGFMQEKDSGFIPYKAKISIKIINENEEIVYDNAFNVNEGDYTFWSNELWEEDKLLGCIYIEADDIEKGTSTEGILSINVEFEDETRFEEYSLNIHNLPVYEFSIELPKMPYIIENYNTDNELITKIEVLEIIPVYSNGTLSLQFKAKMIYNSEANSSGYAYIGYKIKDEEGVIISSNHSIIGPLEEGEALNEKEYCRGEFVIGKNYILELIDVK